MDAPVLMLAQIRATYPNEWVVIARHTEGRYGQRKTGRVVCHRPNKEAAFRRAMGIPSPRSIAFLFMGGPELAPHEAFAL
jgi:ribulose bisphosphate carboxylase small subunit